MFASINRPGWRAVRSSTGGRVGIVLFSGAIIISLLAMRSRAPEWLLMFCGGWTLFTLANVSWQPLMVFQLALIWGGYTFLAPQGLPQRKFWDFRFWEPAQRGGMKPARVIHPEGRSIPTQMIAHAIPEASSAEWNHSASASNHKSPRLNKIKTFKLFIIIFSINIFIHLIPFNYSRALVVDEIARAVGITLAIYLFSLWGLLFGRHKTLAVSLIAILFAPIAIIIDRANDPIAPPFFRELLHGERNTRDGALGSEDEANIDEMNIAAGIERRPDDVDQGIVDQSTMNDPEHNFPQVGDAESSRYRQLLDAYSAADPNLNPGMFDTSNMPMTKAAEVERTAAAQQREVFAGQDGNDPATVASNSFSE